MGKYKTVIFDMDGTLLDTLKDLQCALNFSLSAFGFAEHTLDEVRSYIGAGMSKLIELALPNDVRQRAYDSGDRTELDGVLSAVTDKFAEYYIAHGEDNTRPYDGIIELLKTLKANGIKTAVVSNKVEIAVESLNDKCFFGLIDTAVGDGNGIKLKPAPDMLFVAMDKLGADKNSTVFVGDGDTDIYAAKAAGLPCISVSYGYKTEEF
ncbi:MAG: HAD-IA family hydrolase, partial [Clostridia bacterium]|nr:HAD-IA family hydrolase [Clostridia bacterium]